jgi:hypothetical protein
VRAARIALLVLVLNGVGLTIGCGGGGGGGRGASHAGEVAQTIESWVRSWSGKVHSAPEPPTSIRLPSPPKVTFGESADQLAAQVDDSVSSLSSAFQTNYDQTKSVLCTWFGFYIDTGQPVPSQGEFEQLVLQNIFGRVFPAGPPQQIRNAIELFRGAIEQAQTEDQAGQFLAAAAVCSVPG